MWWSLRLRIVQSQRKLRLILGGPTSEPFKFVPPKGYRGVGEAVLEAVVERHSVVEKESTLQYSSKAASDDARPFFCDFSDGEHGHELMALGSQVLWV